MAEHDFTTLMAALDSPLIVVTTADERERAGCLVEFHVQSSIDPHRYCVWLSKANYRDDRRHPDRRHSMRPASANRTNPGAIVFPHA
jgi:flavin reductase (DIM6/NTAB) family NADH-FMN oxidoreductase RutF